MTSLLETKLPPELFLDISEHLAFFDKKALALTSKKCCALLGSIKCPNRLSWMVYLCVLMKWYPAYEKPILSSLSIWNQYLAPRNALYWFHQRSKIYLSHATISLELCELDERMHIYCGSLEPKQFWAMESSFDIAPVSRKAFYREGPFDEPLMNSYFYDLEFPVSTLACYYIEKLDGVAQDMLKYSSKAEKGAWIKLHVRLAQSLECIKDNELKRHRRQELVRVDTLRDPDEGSDYSWGGSEVDFDAVEHQTPRRNRKLYR